MPWLPGLMLLPLIALIALVFAPAKQAKWIALGGTLATFIWSILAALAFDWDGRGYQLAQSFDWLADIGLRFDMAVDSVSMLLILLTTFLMPLCVWGSFSSINDRLKEYYGWLLAILSAMVGVFLARDVIFFYVCFEFTLIPMYFLIAIYGGSNRAAACTKFFLYTFAGSVITLAGVIYVAWQYSLSAQAAGAWSFDIGTLTAFAQTMTPTQQMWVLIALLSGFAVKVPLFPVHTWLPLAHTEAPTAGSVILAGVLLKLGTYGFYRFVLPMTPDGLFVEGSFTWLSFIGIEFDFYLIQLIAGLSIVGILYAALICWVQTDVKKLVAYSSVSHLGFCILGLMALNPLGLQGSVLYMINHGLSTGALFFCIGMIYERYHTRDMDQLGGLAKKMPVWAFFMVFFTLASVGLPGLNGFVSEFLCLIAAFTANADNAQYPGVLGPWYAAIAGIGMIFAAMYLLYMVGKVVFGPVKTPGSSGGHDHHGHGHDDHASDLPTDLTPREIGVLAPLAILCLWLGFQPTPLMNAMQPSIEETLAAYPDRVRAMMPVAQQNELIPLDETASGTTRLANDEQRTTNNNANTEGQVDG